MLEASTTRNEHALQSEAWGEALRAAFARIAGTPPAGEVTCPALSVAGLRRLSGGASQETWSFDLVEGDRVTPLILRRAPTGWTASPRGARASASSPRALAPTRKRAE